MQIRSSPKFKHQTLVNDWLIAFRSTELQRDSIRLFDSYAPTGLSATNVANGCSPGFRMTSIYSQGSKHSRKRLTDPRVYLL